VYGPWQRPNHDYAAVIPKWIWNAMNGNALELHGDGLQSRDFTYVSSVVDVLKEGMRSGLNLPQPVNLAFGQEISLSEVLQSLTEHFGHLEVKRLPARAGDIRSSLNDPKKLLNLFPSINPIPFEEGIRSTIDWFSKSDIDYEYQTLED
jgi:UDP-glucose 4-epimerase